MSKLKAIFHGVTLLCASAGGAGCAFLMPSSRTDSAPQPVAPILLAATPQQQSVAELSRQAAGPSGGWIIGASTQNLSQHSVGAATKANQQAEQRPAGTTSVGQVPGADLNNDGFVTLDEILALKRAGLQDSEMIDRIRQTDAVFDLSNRQQQYLRDRGINQSVINAMLEKNGSASNPPASP